MGMIGGTIEPPNMITGVTGSFRGGGGGGGGGDYLEYLVGSGQNFPLKCFGWSK